MYLKVVRGMPKEPTEHVIAVSQNTRLKYPSRVGPMTRAMTTVVSKVLAKTINTSKPMKMKLRPITLALLEADGGSEGFNLFKPILMFDITFTTPPGLQNCGLSVVSLPSRLQSERLLDEI